MDKEIRRMRREIEQAKRNILLEEQEARAESVRSRLVALANMAPGIRRSKFWRKQMRMFAPSPKSFAPWFVRSILQEAKDNSRIVQAG